MADWRGTLHIDRADVVSQFACNGPQAGPFAAVAIDGDDSNHMSVIFSDRGQPSADLARSFGDRFRDACYAAAAQVEAWEEERAARAAEELAHQAAQAVAEGRAPGDIPFY